MRMGSCWFATIPANSTRYIRAGCVQTRWCKNGMGDEPESAAADDSSWTANYFNYFTEIEEHFQRARGTSLFLLSPLDWALIESWKNAGVPLEAVLRGIDEAFDKWRSRKTRTRMVNSLAYCTQAVLEVAGRMAGAGISRTPKAAECP